MRRRQHRHPAVETAVFAAALLLAAFIARELWVRRAAAAPEPEKVTMPAVLEISYPPLPQKATEQRTEQAVSGVAPIKLTRMQPRKQKLAPVPAPR